MFMQNFESQTKSIMVFLKVANKTPLLPPKNLHWHCFRFLLSHLHVPREIKYNHYANFEG